MADTVYLSLETVQRKADEWQDELDSEPLPEGLTLPYVDPVTGADVIGGQDGVPAHVPTLRLSVYVIEDLTWHLEHYGIEDTDAACEELGGDIVRAWADHYGIYEHGPEFDFLLFEFSVTVPAWTRYEDALGALYDSTVQFRNEADPGTFGCQYVPGQILERFADELAPYRTEDAEAR